MEEAIEESDTQIDDVLILPLLELIRSAFGIPDND
jgi:hypothetical protein